MQSSYIQNIDLSGFWLVIIAQILCCGVNINFLQFTSELRAFYNVYYSLPQLQ